jgi:hypothetical protein
VLSEEQINEKRWAGLVASKLLVVKSEQKTPLGSCRCRYEDNIKMGVMK